MDSRIWSTDLIQIKRSAYMGAGTGIRANESPVLGFQMVL